MAVGDSALFAGESYMGIGREGTFGTYATCTASLDFLSSSLKTTKDSKILQQIERSRTMRKNFALGKMIEGDIEFYPSTDVTASSFLLQNAFGGYTVTSSAISGAVSYTHEIALGSYTQDYPGISVNERKGPASTGKVFEYHGGRINTFNLTAELDEPLVANASMVFLDSTKTANDISSALTSTAYEVLSFANGRFSMEGTFASLTSSSFWHVQSINFTLNNSLKTDASARRIGSDTLALIPYGVQSYELSCQIRFDTTTAFDAMIAGTEYAAEFEFQGTTITGSETRRGLSMLFPSVVVKDAGDPEIAGPDETLISTVTFNVLRDDSSSTGYACKAILTNGIASI